MNRIGIGIDMSMFTFPSCPPSMTLPTAREITRAVRWQGSIKIKEKDSLNYRDERRDGCWPYHSNITQNRQCLLSLWHHSRTRRTVIEGEVKKRQNKNNYWKAHDGASSYLDHMYSPRLWKCSIESSLHDSLVDRVAQFLLTHPCLGVSICYPLGKMKASTIMRENGPWKVVMHTLFWHNAQPGVWCALLLIPERC